MFLPRIASIEYILVEINYRFNFLGSPRKIIFNETLDLKKKCVVTEYNFKPIIWQFYNIAIPVLKTVIFQLISNNCNSGEIIR